MNIEEFRNWCLSLEGSTEDVKWGNHLCFMIEEKIFLMCSLEAPHSFSVKILPQDFDNLVQQSVFQQAPYSAKRQWILVESLEACPVAEIRQLVLNSRELVLQKLSKKIQAKYAAH